MFDRLDKILNALNEGQIICLADSPDLENEIDMMCLAKYAVTDNINYMIAQAGGLVCCSMSAQLCDKIGFEPMINNNIQADRLGTPFYQSVDLNNGSTGVSAVERGNTARFIADGSAVLKDFVSPGHLFTLRAKPELLKVRQGHTEASVQLAKLCSEEAAVICEIIKNSGEMLTVKDFDEWNKNKGLLLYSIDQLIKEIN